MPPIRMTIQVTTPRTYLRRVEIAVYGALDQAVETTTEYGQRVAKRLAPVRKVTTDSTPARARNLTQGEIADLPEQVRKGLNPVSGASLRTGRLPRTTTRRAGASHFAPRTRGGTLRETARDVEFDRGTGFPRLKDRSFESRLSSRGRYEFRSERAIHTERNLFLEGSRVRRVARTTLGGRLRSEIRTTLVRLASQGGVSETRLESPTEYAGYVEYPTSRTAAQPYMRPAREAMKPVLVRETDKELRRAGRYV
jgi:hypothetical protein